MAQSVKIRQLHLKDLVKEDIYTNQNNYEHLDVHTRIHEHTSKRKSKPVVDRVPRLPESMLGRSV